MKFTKGPWQVGGGEEGGVDTHIYCGDFSGSAVACVEFAYVRRSKAEMTANAHLMAAAPQMYEALKELIESLAREHSFAEAECYADSMYGRAYAAIRAAEGRTA